MYFDLDINSLGGHGEIIDRPIIIQRANFEADELPQDPWEVPGIIISSIENTRIIKLIEWHGKTFVFKEKAHQRALGQPAKLFAAIRRLKESIKQVNLSDSTSAAITRETFRTIQGIISALSVSQEVFLPYELKEQYQEVYLEDILMELPIAGFIKSNTDDNQLGRLKKGVLYPYIPYLIAPRLTSDSIEINRRNYHSIVGERFLQLGFYPRDLDPHTIVPPGQNISYQFIVIDTELFFKDYTYERALDLIERFSHLI